MHSTMAAVGSTHFLSVQQYNFVSHLLQINTSLKPYVYKCSCDQLTTTFEASVTPLYQPFELIRKLKWHFNFKSTTQAFMVLHTFLLSSHWHTRHPELQHSTGKCTHAAKTLVNSRCHKINQVLHVAPYDQIDT